MYALLEICSVLNKNNFQLIKKNSSSLLITTDANPIFLAEIYYNNENEFSYKLEVWYSSSIITHHCVYVSK